MTPPEKCPMCRRGSESRGQDYCCSTCFLITVNAAQPDHAADNAALRERSGRVDATSKLVSFLYTLMRDHVTPGVVEVLVRDAQVTPVEFTNGHLARYAQDIADRLN
mgnify:CR=1 FL=1